MSTQGRMILIQLCLVALCARFGSALQYPNADFLHEFVQKHDRKFITIYLPEDDTYGWANWHRTSFLRYVTFKHFCLQSVV